MKRTPSLSVLGFLLDGMVSATFPLQTLAQTPPGYILMLTVPAPPSITAPAGGAAISTIFIIPLNGFTGTINFTCTITGGSAPLPTCSNPASVNVTGLGAVASTVTVTTTNVTPTATYTITVSGAGGRAGTAPANGPQSMPLAVSHSYSVGNDGGGGVALLTLAGLLAVWTIGRLWWGKRAADLK